MISTDPTTNTISKDKPYPHNKIIRIPDLSNSLNKKFNPSPIRRYAEKKKKNIHHNFSINFAELIAHFVCTNLWNQRLVWISELQASALIFKYYYWRQKLGTSLEKHPIWRFETNSTGTNSKSFPARSKRSVGYNKCGTSIFGNLVDRSCSLVPSCVS